MYGTNPDQFGLDMILQEAAHPPVVPVPDQTPEPEEPAPEPKNVGRVILINATDVDRSNRFRLDDVDDDVAMPIDGPGELESLIIKADSSNFHVLVRLDGNHIVDDTWTTLESHSLSLNRVGAFTNDTDGDGTADEWVVTASDYPFAEELMVVIHPLERVTFTLLRAEIDVYD